MLKPLLLVCLLLSQGAFAADDEQNHAIHQELRGVLQGIQTAINAKKYADLKQYFDEKPQVTTINQNIINTPEGIDAYFKSWFGKGGYLKKLDISLKPDTLTQRYGDPANPS